MSPGSPRCAQAAASTVQRQTGRALTCARARRIRGTPSASRKHCAPSSLLPLALACSAAAASAGAPAPPSPASSAPPAAVAAGLAATVSCASRASVSSTSGMMLRLERYCHKSTWCRPLRLPYGVASGAASRPCSAWHKPEHSIQGLCCAMVHGGAARQSRWRSCRVGPPCQHKYDADKAGSA